MEVSSPKEMRLPQTLAISPESGWLQCEAATCTSSFLFLASSFSISPRCWNMPSRHPQGHHYCSCFSATSIRNQINSSPLQSHLCYFCQRNMKQTKVQVKNQSFSRANSASQSRGRCPRHNSDNGAWHRGTGFFVFLALEGQRQISTSSKSAWPTDQV